MPPKATPSSNLPRSIRVSAADIEFGNYLFRPATKNQMPKWAFYFFVSLTSWIRPRS